MSALRGEGRASLTVLAFTLAAGEGLPPGMWAGGLAQVLGQGGERRDR